MTRPSTCFFVMPFKPELNYFYLYIRGYLYDKFGLKVERGDQKILTKALMDKIREQIIACDFMVADITSGNPNVFYEIGLGHAFNKAIIFITQDAPAEAPVDVRQFEFIQYELGRHQDFLAKLDNAIQNIVITRYQEIYEVSIGILREFNQYSKANYIAASLEEFQARVMRTEQTQVIPSKDDPERLSVFLLPKIIKDANDITVMQSVMDWIKSRRQT